MDAEEEEDSAAESGSVLPEPSALELTGQRGRRWKGMTAEMFEKGDNMNIAWQVKMDSGAFGQGSTWLDMHEKWFAACEEVYRYTKDWTDSTWATHDCPTIKGSDIEQPGYIIIFGMHEIFQQNIFSGTMRPVRRMDTTWGQDGSIVYKTKEEQKASLEAARYSTVST